MTLIPITERTQYCFADCGKEICQCKPSKNIEQKMQTLDEIKQLRAYEMNYVDWEEFIYSVDDPNILDMEFDEVANIFAREVAREALKNAAENAKYTTEDVEFCYKVIIDKQSILNENNMPEL